MPSFLGAFLAALGAAEPFGVKHHAARPSFGRPVGVPSVVLAGRLGLSPPPCGYRFAPLSLARACLAALLFPPMLRCVVRSFLVAPCAFVRCRSSRPTFVGLARVARRLAPQPLSRATTAGAACTALLAACGRLWASVRVPSPSPPRISHLRGGLGSMLGPPLRAVEHGAWKITFAGLHRCFVPLSFRLCGCAPLFGFGCWGSDEERERKTDFRVCCVLILTFAPAIDALHTQKKRADQV